MLALRGARTTVSRSLEGGEKGDWPVTGAFVGWLVGFEQGNDPSYFPLGRDDGLVHHIVKEVGEVGDRVGADLFKHEG